jgi:hypothetical protein
MHIERREKTGDGECRHRGVGGGYPLLLWENLPQLSPKIGENLTEFSPILGETRLKSSLISRENSNFL